MSTPTTTPPLRFIIFMAAMMSTTALSIDAMLPALGIIGRDLGVSDPNHTQYIILFVFIGMALGQLFAGPLSDALGRKRLLFIALGIYILGALICLYAPSIEIILLGRVIQGMGASGPFVTTQSIIRDKYAGRGMAKVMSLIMTIFILAPAIAPAIGQTILFVASWRAIFLFFVIFAVAIALIAYFRLEETLTTDNRRPYRATAIFRGFAAVFAHRPTLLYALSSGVVFAGFIGYLTSSQQVYLDQYDKGALFPLFFGLQALCMGISSIFNSRIVERFGMSFIITRALIFVMAISSAIAIYSAVAIVPFWVYFIFGAALLASVGMLFGNLNALALEAMGHMAGTAAAVIGFMNNAISLSLGAIIGQAYNGTLLPMAIGFILASFAALNLVRLADRKKATLAMA